MRPEQLGLEQDEEDRRRRRKNCTVVVVDATASSMDRNQKLALSVLVASVFVSAIAGFLCAYAFAHPSITTMRRLNRDAYREDESVTDAIFEAIDGQEMGTYVDWIAKSPHVAGTQRDKEIAEWIKKMFHAAQLDFVGVSWYDTLLSYSNPNRPNSVELLDGAGTVVFATATNIADSSIAGNGGQRGNTDSRNS
jgi:hypothetical protein